MRASPDASVDTCGTILTGHVSAAVIAAIETTEAFARPTSLARLIEAATVAGADAAALCGACEPAEVNTFVEAARSAGLWSAADLRCPEDAATLASAGVWACRLAASDLTNPFVLDAAASLGVTALLHTAAATPAEVGHAVACLRRWGARFVLIHGGHARLTRDDGACLSRVGRLAERHGCEVGYADRTRDLNGGAVAVACGAGFVEKLLTISSPDVADGLDARQLREYVSRLRSAEAALRDEAGDADAEREARRAERQSIALRCPLAAGAALAMADLTCRPPGTGIPARRVAEVLGMVVARDLPAGALLDWFDLDAASSARAA